MNGLIDLRTYVQPLTTFIRDAVAKFAEEMPDVPAATLGLWGDGFHGGVALLVDTPEHRDAFVSRYAPRVARDSHGAFCDNCWDYPHDLGDWSFPDWPNLYELPHQPSYITLEGELLRLEPEAGEFEKHEALFPLLTTVMTDMGDFPELHRVAPFRVGVQMSQSLLDAFRVVELPPSA